MTTLAIIANYEKKRLKCFGTVAAGEHVAVTVTNGAQWIGEGKALRLRILFGPDTVGVFPFADGDAWTAAGQGDADATCELNLNTLQAAKYLKFGGTCLWILDDIENHTLYATGEFEVLPWPKRRGIDEPIDLDGYPNLIDDINELKEAWTEYQQRIAQELAQKQDVISDLLEIRNGATAGASAVQPGAIFEGGKIKSGFLPSYVDDVIEVENYAALPPTGEEGKIYIAKDTNVQYRWSGTQYTEIAKMIYPATTAPKIAGTAAVGSSAKYAREDHVHPAETSVENVYRLPDDCFPVRYLNSSTGEYHTIYGNNGLVFIADAGIIYMCDKSDTDTGYPYGYFEVGMFSEAAPNKFLGTGTFVGTGTYDLTFGGEPREPQSWPRLSYGPGRVTVRGVTAATVAEVEDIARWKLDKTEADEKFVAKSGVASTVTKEGANPVKSSGIWAAIWGALAALPTGFSSLYDWVVNQLAGKLDKGSQGTLPLVGYDIGIKGMPGGSPGDWGVGGYGVWYGQLQDYTPSTDLNEDNVQTGRGVIGWNKIVSASKLATAIASLANRASPATNGNLAALDSNGNPTDSGIKPSDKLDSTSAAPAFSTSSTYEVGDHVTYNGKLYRCTTAVTTAGAWTGDTNWTADTMTDPDATLDVTSQNQLRVVAKDGTLLWAQGYDLASTSSATLACDAVNNFTFADGATTQAFALPTAPTGKVGDFGLDIDNSANTGEATLTLTGLDTTFSVVVPEGESLTDMLAIAAGELARFYVTLTTFRVNSLPTWHIVKQVVENGGAQS